MPDDIAPAEPDLVSALQAAEEPSAAPAEPSATPAEAQPAELAAEPRPAELAAEPSDAGSAESAADDDALKLTRFIDENWGEKLAEKYTGDNATITGLIEAYRMAGRRNADAEFGRAVKEHEPAFREFLQQRQQRQQPEHPPAQQSAPEWDEIRRWQEIVAREGENAPADVRRNLEDATQKIQRAAYEWTYHRDKVLAEPVRQLSTPVAQGIAQQQEGQAQERQWCQGFEDLHGGWIYRDQRHTPDNFTPEGERLMVLAGMEKQRGRSDPEALHYARLALLEERLQQQQAQQPQPVQPVKPAAQHQPAVAAPAGGDPEADYQDYLKKFGGQPGALGDHLAKLFAQKEAMQGQLG